MPGKVKVTQVVELKCDFCNTEKTLTRTKNNNVKSFQHWYGTKVAKPKNWCGALYNHPQEMKGMIFCSTECRQKLFSKMRKIIDKHKNELKNLRSKLLRRFKKELREA